MTPRIPKTVAIAAVLTTVGAVSAAIGLAQTVAHLPSGFALGAVLVLIGFGLFFISLPVIAAAFLFRGRQWPKYLLVIVALGNLATSSIDPQILVGTVAASGAAVFSWLPVALRFAAASKRAATVGSLGGRWPRTSTDAYLWWAFSGLVGGHLFYLGRSWQGLLYVVLTALAILSVPSVMAVLFFTAVGLATLVDAARIPGWVEGTRWER